jgi:hypothetical protein
MAKLVNFKRKANPGVCAMSGNYFVTPIPRISANAQEAGWPRTGSNAILNHKKTIIL